MPCVVCGVQETIQNQRAVPAYSGSLLVHTCNRKTDPIRMISISLLPSKIQPVWHSMDSISYCLQKYDAEYKCDQCSKRLSIPQFPEPLSLNIWMIVQTTSKTRPQYCNLGHQSRQPRNSSPSTNSLVSPLPHVIHHASASAQTIHSSPVSPHSDP